MRPRRVLLVMVLALVGAAIVVMGLMVHPGARSSNNLVNSEQIVREFAKTMNREVGTYRRGLRTIIGQAEQDAGFAATALATIDARAAETVKKIREHVRVACATIDDMIDLSMQTQDNRVSRIRTRATEAEQIIASVAMQAKADVQEHH